MSENFAFNLRVAMAARDVSQTALSECLGISKAFVSEMYRGNKMPNSARLVGISRILNVSIDYLMGADDVFGQIDDVMRNKPVRMTARQAYEASMRKGGVE